MRAFVAIDLPDKWRRAFAECGSRTRDALPAWRDVRWTPDENLHITAVFLGEITDEVAGLVTEAFGAAVRDTDPFALTLIEPVTGGPTRRAPRMLWSTFADPSERCTELVRDLRAVAHTHGVPVEDRPFRPHVTLARARRPLPLGQLPDYRDILDAHLGCGPDRLMSVGECTLYSSTLSRQGAHYERLGRLKLGRR